MLLTLTVGTASQQFNLQHQFAQRPPPTDIGDRLARGETQLLRVTGRQSDPDSASPGAISLRDYVVERVSACSCASSPHRGVVAAVGARLDLCSWQEVLPTA